MKLNLLQGSHDLRYPVLYVSLYWENKAVKGGRKKGTCVLDRVGEDHIKKA